MLHHRADEGSPAWDEWHEMRQYARETAMDITEFSEIEREKYDLATAEIDGESNPRTYTTEPYGEKESMDIRELPRH